jgi:histone-lysine N-methyltransferase SETD3
MGFDIREQVQFHRSSCPDAIATILERILQIARIIHLDEVN